MPRLADIRLPDLYRLTIALFSLLFLFQLFTGIWLFALKLGWSPGLIERYYLGDPAAFARPKTVSGLLETTMPHLIAIGTTGFIIAHFLMFVPRISERKKWLGGLGLMTGAILDLGAGYLVILVSKHFVFLKLAGFLLFEISVFASLYWIARGSASFVRARNEDAS